MKAQDISSILQLSVRCMEILQSDKGVEHCSNTNKYSSIEFGFYGWVYAATMALAKTADGAATAAMEYSDDGVLFLHSLVLCTSATDNLITKVFTPFNQLCTAIEFVHNA